MFGVVVVSAEGRNAGLLDEPRRSAEQCVCLPIPSRAHLRYQGGAHMARESSPALVRAAQNVMQGELVRVIPRKRVQVVAK